MRCKISLIILLWLFTKLLHAHTLTPLYLLAFVNGKSTNLIIEVYQNQDGDFFIPPSELDEIGINISKLNHYYNNLIDIYCEIAIKTNYIQEAQELHLTVAPYLIKPKTLNLRTNKTEQTENAKADLGSVLNYSIYLHKTGNNLHNLNSNQNIAGNFELRFFTDKGIFITNHTANKSQKTKSDNHRLDTYFSVNDEEYLINYTAGDFITNSANWMRSNRLGGIQIKRNFKLRSNLITMPLIPDYSGTASVPSTIEVYLNQGLYLKYDLDTGPFTITDIPTASGYNNVNIVTYDMLGRKISAQYPFYASAEQLAKGVSDFSIATGLARKFYGVQNNNYDNRLATTSSVRYGLSDYLTIEFEAQHTNNFYNAGFGTVSNLANLAIVNLAYAKSDYMGINGHINYSAIETTLGMFQLQLSSLRSFDEFNDISSVTAQTAKQYLELPQNLRSAQLARKNQQLTLGLLGLENNSINLSYAHNLGFDNKRARLIAVNFGTKINRFVNANLTFSDNLEEQHAKSLFLGISIPLGSNIMSQISVDKKHKMQTTSVEVNKSLSDQIGSFGFNLRKNLGNSELTEVSGSYLSSKARFKLSASDTKNASSVGAEATGALIFMHQELSASNMVNDSFAIVDAGAPNIEVRYENRLAGYTKDNGKLLLTNLRSYENNKVSIDPLNMPLDAKVEITNMNVKPKEKSGIVANFKVLTTNKTALISVIDNQGNYIKAGLIATLNNKDKYIIGYDGLLFLDNINETNRINIKLNNNKSCTVTFNANINNLTRTELYNLICE